MNDHETRLEVTGMTCGSCVRHVTEALRAVAGVRDVEVQLRDGVVRVWHGPEVGAGDALVAAVRAAGYGAAVGRWDEARSARIATGGAA